MSVSSKSKAEVQKASADLENTKAKLDNVNDAIAWLDRKQLENPEATDAAFQRCRAPGQDISVTLNCMHGILGE